MSTEDSLWKVGMGIWVYHEDSMAKKNSVLCVLLLAVLRIKKVSSFIHQCSPISLGSSSAMSRTCILYPMAYFDALFHHAFYPSYGLDAYIIELLRG